MIPAMFEGQADGAIPNGTRIYKCHSDPDEPHQDGSSGVVVGSTEGPIKKREYIKAVYIYSVFWDDLNFPMTIFGDQITTEKPVEEYGIDVIPESSILFPTHQLVQSHGFGEEGVRPDPGANCPAGRGSSCVSGTGSSLCAGFFGTTSKHGSLYTRCVWKDQTNVNRFSNSMKKEPVVKIYKDMSTGANGNGAFAISTTASEADEFLRECAVELELVSTELVGDLEFTYNALLPQICELWAKLRGYKADTVFEHKILVIGEPHPEAHMTLLNSRGPVREEGIDAAG